MKKLSAIVIALAMSVTTVGPAAARQSNGITGVLLGGAGGAIVGQAITGNPRGVIAGSIIGSTLGMLIDVGSPRDRLVVIDRPRHLPRAGYVSGNHRGHRRDRWEHRRRGQQWRSDRWQHRR